MIRRGSLEAPTFVAGLDDVAVMGEAVEERGGHLGVAEDGRPFAEGEVRGDDDGALLVELADQVEEQLSAGLGKGQIAEFVEDDEVHACEIIGHAALAAGAGFGLELVDEIDDVEEAASSTGTDACPGDRDGEMGLAGPSPADEDNIALVRQEVAAGEIMNEGLVDRGSVEGEVGDILGERQLGDGDLIDLSP